jgi:hypothetical protein
MLLRSHARRYLEQRAATDQAVLRICRISCSGSRIKAFGKPA